jgi:hypothetical protein
MSSVVLTQELVPLPGLIQEFRLTNGDDPLIYKAYQVALPPDAQLNRQKPMVIFSSSITSRRTGRDRLI